MPQVQNKRSKNRKHHPPAEGSKGFPDRLKKSGCIYIDGLIEHTAHGTYNCKLENGLDAICTARKMENVRISLMPGDKVVVEIPASALNPNEERQRGRVVWRHQTR